MASTAKKAKDELEKQKAILKVMESQETILGSLIKAFQGQEDSVGGQAHGITTQRMDYKSRKSNRNSHLQLVY
jgi:hypothetical protein